MPTSWLSASVARSWLTSSQTCSVHTKGLWACQEFPSNLACQACIPHEGCTNLLYSKAFAALCASHVIKLELWLQHDKGT